MTSATTARPTPQSDRLVWIDLEMTGLDPKVHVIIQAAIIVTDNELNVLDEAACDIWQPETALEAMSPFVRQMHTKTGLLERLPNSLVDLSDAERQLMTIVAKWCSFPATLCGNSIWSDRKFIDAYMPGLSAYLHYRMLDVSSLKVLAGRWFGAEAQFQKPAAGAHDALVDIRNSITELHHYREHLFKQGLIRA